MFWIVMRLKVIPSKFFCMIFYWNTNWLNNNTIEKSRLTYFELVEIDHKMFWIVLRLKVIPLKVFLHDFFLKSNWFSGSTTNKIKCTCNHWKRAFKSRWYFRHCIVLIKVLRWLLGMILAPKLSHWHFSHWFDFLTKATYMKNMVRPIWIKRKMDALLLILLLR